jgi:hypothetical protein
LSGRWLARGFVPGHPKVRRRTPAPQDGTIRSLEIAVSRLINRLSAKFAELGIASSILLETAERQQFQASARQPFIA